MSPEDVVDITILGAGPSGLAAAYYAGHRDATVRIVESLEQLGGQVAAVYPEKHVYDVAGYPKILAQELVDRCAEQGLQYGADVKLGEEVQTLERINQNGEELLAVSTNKGGPYLSRALIITAGHGAFEPRALGIDGIEEWEGRGLHYFVREKETFRDRRCIIIGGGDSALDWTLGLQDTAAHPIALIHRRDRFRALESSVNEARALEEEGRVRMRDRRVGPRPGGKAADPDRPHDLRDQPLARLRGRRCRRLPGEDHADHDRDGRGGDRGQQCGCTDSR